MIKPYTAVGLVPTVRGIRKRKTSRSPRPSLAPREGRLLAVEPRPARAPHRLPRGRAAAFNDEVLDLDHAPRARVRDRHPGDETEAARQDREEEYDGSSLAQAKAGPRPERPVLHVGFVITRAAGHPQALQVSPLFPVEHSVCPTTSTDGGSRSTPHPGRLWPVVDTEIGRLGIMMANEGSYHRERAGARAERRGGRLPRLLPAPATGNEMFEIQSRARALDNTCTSWPRTWHLHLFPEETTPIDTRRPLRTSSTTRGASSASRVRRGSTYVRGVIDIEALRDHRARAQWDNWLKDVRTELYQLLYEQPSTEEPLLKRAPMKHREYRDKVIKRQIKLMHDRASGRSPSAEMPRPARR